MTTKKAYGKWSIRLEEVIIAELTIRGDGTDDNPYRRITEVFTKDGVFVAEDDPFINKKINKLWNER